MEQEPSTVDIRKYAALLMRWLWLIALGTAVAGVLAFVASRLMTPIYEASTTLLIREGSKTGGPDYNSILMSERLAQTYTQLLTDTPVLEETALRLGLDISEEQFRKMVSAQVVRDTQLIDLKVQDADPELAASIANTIPQVFIEQNAEMESARFGSSMESLEREMAELQREVDTTQDALESERSKPRPDSAEVARLESLLAEYRGSYTSLVQSYEQTRLAEATTSNTVIITKPAKAPSKPVLPRTMLNTVLAAVVGAMLAAGVALLIEYVDDTIKHPTDVERVAHLSTLAAVFRFGPTLSNGGGPLMVADPRSAAAEAYRLLRTNLQFATITEDGAGVALLLTSAQPQEGKSTTLVNLGISLAQIGKRVLLVDCDLRRPTLHKHFSLPNTSGFTSLFLLRELHPEQVVQRTSVPALSIVTSGPIPANPAEVLDYPQAASLLGQLKEMADYVLVDSPPVLSAADASILARKVDGVLLVVETGRTRSDALRNAVSSLQHVQAHVVGVVLNKVVAHRNDCYQYYNYDYYYGSEGSKHHRRRSAAAGRPAAQPQVTAQVGTAQGAAAVPARGHRPRESGRRAWFRSVTPWLAGVPLVLAAVVTVGSIAAQLAAGNRGTGIPTASPMASQATPSATLAVAATPEVPSSMPTPRPSPTAELAATPSLTAAITMTPSASPPQTPTELPTAMSQLQPTAAHGLIGRLRLRDERAGYAAGEEVFFAVELENTTDGSISLGIVGLKADRAVPFESSWPEVTIAPRTTFAGEGQLTFPTAGTYTVKVGACFSSFDACQREGADWVEYEPGVAVNVR